MKDALPNGGDIKLPRNVAFTENLGGAKQDAKQAGDAAANVADKLLSGNNPVENAANQAAKNLRDAPAGVLKTLQRNTSFSLGNAPEQAANAVEDAARSVKQNGKEVLGSAKNAADNATGSNPFQVKSWEGLEGWVGGGLHCICQSAHDSSH